YKKIKMIIKTNKYDAIICLPQEIGVYTRLFYKKSDTKIIISERNDPSKYPTSKITRKLRNLMYKKSDGLIFQTKEALEYFPKDIQKKGIILKNPLSIDYLPTRNFDSITNEIVTVGRLVPQKNHKMLIEAFSEVLKDFPYLKLVIYGNGY